MVPSAATDYVNLEAAVAAGPPDPFPTGSVVLQVAGDPTDRQGSGAKLPNAEISA